MPRTLIYTYQRFELYLATRPDLYTPNHMLGTGPGRFFVVNDTGEQVGVNCLGTGPSLTANQLELQAALGVRHVLLIGTAGGLTPDQAPGDIVHPDSAVRADGTSDHYLPLGAPAAPDRELFSAFVKFLAVRNLRGTTAPCWTTAAPFRTSRQELVHYRAEGVRAVEEEVASLYAAAQVLAVRTAATLVLDGVPTEDGTWHIDFAAAQARLQQLFAATLEFAASFQQRPEG